MTANTLINNLKVNNKKLREKVVVNVSLCHTRTSSDSVCINIRNAMIKIGGLKYACIRNDTYSYFMLEFLISNQTNLSSQVFKTSIPLLNFYNIQLLCIVRVKMRGVSHDFFSTRPFFQVNTIEQSLTFIFIESFVAGGYVPPSFCVN